MSDGVTISLDHEQIRAIQQADASSDHRLAFLVFLATLAGNLIALIASLADATNLVVPVLDLVAPMPRLTIAGSTTILGPELRLTSDWIENYQSLNLESLDLPLVGEVERTTKFAVDPVGTLRGIDLAAAGQVQLLAASEALGDEDTRRLATDGVSVLCAAPIGYDVVASGLIGEPRFSTLEPVRECALTNARANTRGAGSGGYPSSHYGGGDGKVYHDR